MIVDDSITFAFFFSSIWTWVFHCNTANTLIISLNTSFHNIYVNYAQMTLMTWNGLPTKCDYIHNFFFAITSLVSNSDFSVANKKNNHPINILNWRHVLFERLFVVEKRFAFVQVITNFYCLLEHSIRKLLRKSFQMKTHRTNKLCPNYIGSEIKKNRQAHMVKIALIPVIKSA